MCASDMDRGTVHTYIDLAKSLRKGGGSDANPLFVLDPLTHTPRCLQSRKEGALKLKGGRGVPTL